MDIEEMKKAIDAFSEYSPAQRKILELLVEVAINNVAHVSVKYITEKTGIRTSTVYFAIKLFLKDGIIQRDQGGSKALILCENKIGYILETYKKKYK